MTVSGIYCSYVLPLFAIVKELHLFSSKFFFFAFKKSCFFESVVLVSSISTVTLFIWDDHEHEKFEFCRTMTVVSIVLLHLCSSFICVLKEFHFCSWNSLFVQKFDFFNPLIYVRLISTTKRLIFFCLSTFIMFMVGATTSTKSLVWFSDRTVTSLMNLVIKI